MSTLSGHQRPPGKRKAKASIRWASRVAPLGTAVAGALSFAPAGALVLVVLIVACLVAYLLTMILFLAIWKTKVVLAVLALLLGRRNEDRDDRDP
jgi:hypothetical protein